MLLGVLAAAVLLAVYWFAIRPASGEPQSGASGAEPAPTESAAVVALPSETLALESWSDNVRWAVNELVAAYGADSPGYDAEARPYAVFDFDNTCSIFDVEEQLAVYQLQIMAFAFDPSELDVGRSGDREHQ